MVKDNEISSLQIPIPKNYTPTPDDKNTSRKLTAKGSKELKLTITCLRALTANKEIMVYAYHEQNDTAANKEKKEALKKTNELHNKANPSKKGDLTTVILTERKQAGKLVVLKNDEPEQKELNVVMIKVKTKVSSRVKTGKYVKKEINKLYDALHHALVHPRIITQLDGKDIILDLKDDKNFKKTLPDSTKPRELGNGYYVYDNGNIHKNQTGFNDYIYDKFINTEIDNKGVKVKPYKDLTRNNGYFLVFIFDDKGNQGGSLLGNVFTDASDNFIKTVALYEIHTGDPATFPHEALHGLQLRHTHQDGASPLEHPNIKYIFPHSDGGFDLATSNIMSYNESKYAYSTWRWQWEIIQANV